MTQTHQRPPEGGKNAAVSNLKGQKEEVYVFVWVNDLASEMTIDGINCSGMKWIARL